MLIQYFLIKETTNVKVADRIKSDCDLALRELLPLDDIYTYVVTDFSSPRSWLTKMMVHSQCTYRHTRGRKPGLKRVLYKAEMHCQNQKKDPTLKQRHKSAEAKSKNYNA